MLLPPTGRVLVLCLAAAALLATPLAAAPCDEDCTPCAALPGECGTRAHGPSESSRTDCRCAGAAYTATLIVSAPSRPGARPAPAAAILSPPSAQPHSPLSPAACLRGATPVAAWAALRATILLI